MENKINIQNQNMTQVNQNSILQQNTKQQTSKPPKYGLAVASFILGLVSFVPLLGVLTGIVAIVLGAISSAKIKKEQLGGKRLAIAGIILGILGIIFTIVLYESLFYWGFVAKNGPFSEPKRMVSQQVLTQNAGYLELYKKKHGNYPETIEELSKDGYTVFPTDHYLKPFYYKVSADGQTYELRSLGQDGEYGTSDDVLPQK